MNELAAGEFVSCLRALPGRQRFVLFVQLHQSVLRDGLFIRELGGADIVRGRFAEEEIVEQSPKDSGSPT